MANDVKILGRSRVVQGGFNTSGTAQNLKEFVWGNVSITAFSGSSVESFTPADLGLTTIDYVDFQVEDTDSNAPTVASFPGAVYDYSNEQIVVNEDVQDGDGADSTATLRFWAVGDSASSSELA